MRRGSVTTYVDDGRRHSAGMVTPEYRSNNRQEFTVNDIDYERTGGCFVSYRKIAFAFVFFLAFVIAAAFIGVYIGSPPDKALQDVLAVLSNDEELPEKYVLSSSIQPVRYNIKLAPIPETEEGHVKLQGRVIIDFQQNGISGPNQLVLNSKHLTYKSCRLLIHDKMENSTSNQPSASRRRKRDTEDVKNDTTATTVGNETVVTTIATTTLPTVLNDTVKAVENTTQHPQIEKNRLFELPLSKTELKISANKTDANGSIYVIFLEKSLQKGNYSLEIDYEATVDDRVLYTRNIKKNNSSKPVIVSMLKPTNAPRLFPTFDETRLKASFELNLLHSNDLKALSNMPLINSSDSNGIMDNTDNLTVDIFGETQTMSAHNFVFVIGNFEFLGEVPIDETPLLKKQVIGYWGDAEHKTQDFYLRDKISPIVTAYAELFQGLARPTKNLSLVAMPVDFDGLSAPGLIIIKESLFYAAASSPSFLKTKALVSLIGFFGQQWLGGLAEAKNWTDAWFIEGSILYLQYALIDKIDPNLEVSKDFLIDVQLEAMENDGYFLSKALDSKIDRTYIEAFDLFDNYRKGACLISMLNDVLNGNSFRSGYAEFLRRWSRSNSDSDEFLHALVGNMTTEVESTNMTKAFTSWTRQPGYPLVNVTWIHENSTVVIRQGKFNFDELWNKEKRSTSTDLWWLPLTYVTSEGNWLKPTTIWMKGTNELTLKNIPYTGNNSWIIVNVNRTGYFRVNYDAANWRSIIDILRTKHDDIPMATRTSLVDDALSLARQGSISYELAFELITYLGPHERNYGPWAAFARHARQLDFALYETIAYPNYQKFMRNLVATLFDEMEAKIDEGTALAMLSVRLACTYEYKKCTTWGRNKWDDLFKNNNENTLLKHVRETVYCSGARGGGPEELSYLMQKSEEATDMDERSRLLSAFGCFQSPWILKKILVEVLRTNKYSHSDVKVILQSYAKNPAAAQTTSRFIQEQWTQIVQRFSNSYWIMKAFVEAATKFLFTEIDLHEFNVFRDKNIDSLKMVGHWVALNEIKAFSWIYRLKESTENIQNWLKSHTNSTV
ncbi:PREDICTED: aminopeptidase N [Ceratosolen solmsi marchali]|uniref:Aminopeptidase N n=1 Tax=Ceratosolen solmsi marchali TaxID=326594 RepID=A0AAJ7DUY2_9HYME|nr:PREDICTED: aminopeptidase N [Ceratosolen solmsi marchali]